MSFLERYGATGQRTPRKPQELSPEQEQLKQEALRGTVEVRSATPSDPWDENPMMISDEGLEDNQYDTLEEYTPDRADAIGHAFVQDNVVGAAVNWAVNQGRFNDLKFPPEEDFTMQDHQYAYELVGREYWDEINSSESLPELQAKIQHYGRITKDAEYLDQLGIEGTLYRVGAFFGDVPILNALHLAAGAGKMGTALESLNKSYAGRALITGTSEAGLESLKYALDERTRDEMDILIAASLGGVLGGLYNPMKYGAEMEEAMLRSTRNTIEESVAAGRVVDSEANKTLVDSLQVNVASYFRDSPSSTMSEMGGKLFHDVMNPTTEFKATESQTAVIDGIQAAFTNNFHPLYKEYLDEVGTGAIGKLTSRYNIGTQENFYETVGRMYYEPDYPWQDMFSPEFIAKAQKAIDNMGKDAYEVLRRNDHPSFTSGVFEKSDDWMPRRWNKERLRQDLAEGRVTKDDLINLFEAGIKSELDKLDVAVDVDRLRQGAEGWVNQLTKPDVRAGEAGYILQEATFQTTLLDMKKALQLTDDEVAVMEEAVRRQREARSTAQGTAQSTKRRNDIDTLAEITTETGNTLRLSNYLETNIEALWQSYGRSMGGDTTLRQLGINSREELGQLRNKVVKELSSADGTIVAGNQKYLNNFDAVVGDLLGMSGKTDPNGDLWKVTRSINNLTRASKLGSTWFAMSAEVSQLVHRLGVTNTIKAIPELKNLARQIKGKDGGAVLKEIQVFESLGYEVRQMPSSARREEMYRNLAAGNEKSALSRAIGKVEEFSDSAAEAAYMLGGTKSGTAVFETLFATGNRVKLAKMASKKRFGARDKWYMKQLGFDEDTSRQILDSIRRYGDPENKALFNLEQWDPELARKFALGVRRQSHIVIQKGNIGDQLGAFSANGALAKDSHIGALALNLRNYMTTAWNKQAGRIIKQMGRGGLDTWDATTNIIMQFGVVGTLGYAAKQGLDYVTGAIDEDTFDERMTPERIAAGTFSMTTFASFLPAIADYPIEAATGDKVFQQGVRGNNFSLLGASGEYVKDVITAPQTAVGLVSPANDVSAYEVKKALGTLPLSTAVGVKQAIANISEMLGETDK